MDRLARLESLLRLVRDRPGITAAAVAAELGTTVRNVFRDLGVLRARGYPIDASRGRGGGLRMPARWGVGRILFATEEAIGVLLCLAVAEHVGLPLFAPNWKSVRGKLVAAFPDAERVRLRQLRQRIMVGGPASARVRESYVPPDVASARRLEQGFTQSRVVEFDYERQDGQRTRRRVEPHVFLLNWPAWYLLGDDHGRAKIRTFRLDRITAVAVTEQEFKPRPHAMVRSMGGIEHAEADRWSL